MKPNLMPMLVAVCAALSIAMAPASFGVMQPEAAAQQARYVDPVGELYGKVSHLKLAEITAIQASADSGNPEAQLEFGMACQTRHDLLGLSFAEGQMQATGWFEKAARQGNALAQRLFAASKVGNPSESMQWYERSAEQGDIGSAYSLGQMYLNGNLTGKPDPVQAAHWFLIAATGGDIEAAFKVGSFFECGSGVPQDDAEAAKWYQVAAEQGWKPAQMQLGRLYANGRGVPQDAQKAVGWYSKAADRYADAAYECASLIIRDHIPGKSKEDARQLFLQAAKLYRKDAIVGVTAASQKLGHMYESATGVNQSYNVAFFWYLVAEQEGSQASADVERVKVRLTAKQVADVQKRVEKWLNDF